MDDLLTTSSLTEDIYLRLHVVNIFFKKFYVSSSFLFRLVLQGRVVRIIRRVRRGTKAKIAEN